MKVFFKIKFLSFFVMFFLLFNVFSLALTNLGYNENIKLSMTEQFFSVRCFSDNIIGKLLLQKMQSGKQNKKNNESKQKNNVVKDFLLSEAIVPIQLSINYVSLLSLDMGNNYVQLCLDKDINYPLKIPFWQIIFLLLILKMLFVVLPRSISINYNKKNIERACIV